MCSNVLSVVAIAQLVEPRIVIPVVVGSSPISHPIIQNPLQFEAGFYIAAKVYACLNCVRCSASV